MAPTFTAIPYKTFKGLKIPSGAKIEYFETATNYIAKPGNIFIVSYPKCGTTWTQHIVYLIFKKGKPAKELSSVLNSIPFIEQDGCPGNDQQPIALKYHVPYELIPYSPQAKYIFITRNPKDTCVSYFHFLKSLPGYNIKSTDFESFFEAFISGELPYGDFFDHLLSWYNHRNDPNVLFLTYESMMANHRASVLRIAEFLEQDIADENDGQVLEDILRYSSLAYMKQTFSGHWRKYLVTSTRIPTEANCTQHNRNCAEDEEGENKPVMIRKGSVGDWKNYFSKDQERRMDEWLERRTEGRVIKQLWSGII